MIEIDHDSSSRDICLLTDGMRCIINRLFIEDSLETVCRILAPMKQSDKANYGTRKVIINRILLLAVSTRNGLIYHERRVILHSLRNEK